MKNLRLLAVVGLVVLLSTAVSYAQWQPPIGIPSPDFGIEETYRMYDDSANRNSSLTYTQNAEGGFYTHYVDNTHPNASDDATTLDIEDPENTSNPGNTERPRRTIPMNLPEGSVVEIHNGPYTYAKTDFHGHDYLPITGTGTPEKPIFIRGLNSENRFIFGEMGDKNQVLMRYSDYIIIENALFERCGLKIYQPSSHISIRHSEFDGLSGNNTGIYIWAYKLDLTPGELKEHIVVYDNEIHSYGVYPPTSEAGQHGMIIDDLSKNVWVVDNTIHNNNEDNIHIIDRDEIPDVTLGANADRIFIGRNVMHHAGENAVDAKGSTNVIVSQNEMYGYAHDISGSGEAIRVNDEGYQENIWIIFNHIYNSKQGISAPTHWEFQPYVIGNIIHDCSDIAINYVGRTAANILYNSDDGLRGFSSSGYAYNNIIFNMDGDYLRASDGFESHHNMFWKDGGTVTGRADGDETCLRDIDPLFVDYSNGDLHLTDLSPAIDIGSDKLEELCATYESLYGVDIRVDYDGNVRPQDVGWDIGAFEYTEGGFLLGDVNGSGDITIYDAALAVKVALGIPDPNIVYPDAADFNQDGDVTIFDAALIVKEALGL